MIFITALIKINDIFSKILIDIQCANSDLLLLLYLRSRGLREKYQWIAGIIRRITGISPCQHIISAIWQFPDILYIIWIDIRVKPVKQCFRFIFCWIIGIYRSSITYQHLCTIIFIKIKSVIFIQGITLYGTSNCLYRAVNRIDFKAFATPHADIYLSACCKCTVDPVTSKIDTCFLLSLCTANFDRLVCYQIDQTFSICQHILNIAVFCGII